jgi:mitochondrial cardiolipin hydrolase
MLLNTVEQSANRALFTSRTSIASIIEELLGEARLSVDAALYRLTNPRLVRALEQAHHRGLRVRLLVDQMKYKETPATQELLAEIPIPFRTLTGRKGEGSKMHHKFAILDRKVILAGSYNWTLESERENYDDLLVLREPALVLEFQQEFDRLWSSAPGARPA